MDGLALLAELTPRAEQLLERHLASAREWFPHELVPWSRGRDFSPGEQWEPEGSLSPAARSALFVNLLTEDNLPYYFQTIANAFGTGGVWGTWSRRWTAEEGRHAIVIRDYLTITRSVDPVALERGRMAQVSGGVVPELRTTHDAFVYTALQEMATRVSHYNTGRCLDDPVGAEIMKRVATDENLHHLFYRDLVSAALEMDPSGVVLAMERQVREFEMPGTGIIGFAGHARAISRAGIYDYSVHHERILTPVLRHWRVELLEGLSADAEVAREALLAHVERVGRVGRHLAERRAEAGEASPEGHDEGVLTPVDVLA